MKKRQITNNELAQKIDGIGSEINGVKSGFLYLKKEMNSRFDELTLITNSAFTSVQEQLDDFTSGQKVLHDDVKIIKSDMQDVKLRLDYHAPKFEVEDLKKRVTRLEKKAGLA